MTRQLNRKHVNPPHEIQGVNQWHHRVIELMLHQPELNQRQRAEALGRTQSWLCQVEASDMFQEELAKARESHRELLSYSTIEKTRAVAELALETMAEKIEHERTNLGLTELKDTAVDTMKMLGYGAPQGGAGGTSVNVAVAVDPGALERARARMAEHARERALPAQRAIVESAAHAPLSDGGSVQVRTQTKRAPARTSSQSTTPEAPPQAGDPP